MTIDLSNLSPMMVPAAEPFSAPVIYSFVLTLLMALAAGLVGSVALMKRMSLAGDVVSHIALPGLGIAYLLHCNPLAGAAVSLLLGSL
ncbi:MAG: metal ABC transporter permease, partial [Candidatus Binataceae bacterium]